MENTQKVARLQSIVVSETSLSNGAVNSWLGESPDQNPRKSDITDMIKLTNLIFSKSTY